MTNRFHVVKQSHLSKHVGYDIYFNNRPFLVQAKRDPRLKRHQAYAIAKLLNEELVKEKKWAKKFDDPYK